VCASRPAAILAAANVALASGIEGDPMTGARVVTAALLIPAVIAAVWWGSTGLVAALGCAVAILALIEFFALGARLGLYAFQIWTIIAAIGIFFQQWSATETKSWLLGGTVRLTSASSALAEIPIELVFFIFILGAAAILFLSRRPLAQALGDLGISAAGLVFIVLPLSAIVRLDAVAVIGPKLLLFALALVWAGDTAAYFVGRSLGRRLMAPQISPKKTWEGAAANLLGSVAVGIAFAAWLDIGFGHMIAMAILANIAGQMGDLLESVYKRSAGAKDSGALLPGHGGMLDRVDALILAAPVVWYYFGLVVGPRS